MSFGRQRIKNAFSAFSQIRGPRKRKARTASVFQRLPLHIAESIARYCISTTIDSKIAYGEYANEKSVWTKLYNVSYSWRELALRYFLQDVVMDTFHITGKGQVWFPRLPAWVKISSVHHNYVKRVNIDPSAILYTTRDASIHDFASAWPETLVFPSARRLCVNLDGLSYGKFDEPSATENDKFYWISQRIRTAMPRIQEVAICDFGSDCLRGRWPFDSQRKTDDFSSMVFGKAVPLDISEGATALIRDYLFVQNSTGLVSIKFRCKLKCYTFGCAVKRSARTLESLDVADANLINIRSIIFGDNDEPIVYPQLKRLKFNGQNSERFHGFIRVDRSIVPFPTLRYLCWHSLYIFEDDTLFRGSSNTLEYLDLKVDANLADILQRYKVFSDGKYSRLCSVAASPLDNSDAALLSRDIFMKSVMGLVAPATEHFSLDFHSSDINTISVSPHFVNIQVLCLAKALPAITDLLSVIRLLPNMAVLNCVPGMIDTKIDSLQFRDFIDGIYAQYYPLSHNFRRWNGLVELQNRKIFMAPYALVFAVLCTNFALAHIPPGCRVQFRNRLQSAIDTGLYDEHLNKIQRII